ncbi:unnamed protein product [Callosobruchus maculatus]|uniref:Protein rolling stone n=1 Tax=Callosobruchus maculatus TaxID=64391 RepID=A0A653BG41_CALMS|nr:unnamed protein product [Callosobruchus maculatus]
MCFVISTFCFNTHDDPSIFITCQWQKDKTVPNKKYLIYRLTVALLFLVTCLYSVYYERCMSLDCFGFWLIYLTHWGYSLCTLQALLAAIMLSASCISKRAGTKCLKMYPCYWLMHTIATPIAFLITSLFWCAVYDPEVLSFDANNYFVHANNSLMMLVDLLVVSHPTKLAHIIYPVSFAFLYMVFTMVYHSLGGVTRDGDPYIYTILNWDDPVPALLLCAGALCLIMVIYVMVYLLSKCRRRLHDKYCIQEQDVE